MLLNNNVKPSFNYTEIELIYDEIISNKKYENTSKVYFNKYEEYIQNEYKNVYSTKSSYYYQSENAWIEHYKKYPLHNHGYISYIRENCKK